MPFDTNSIPHSPDPVTGCIGSRRSSYRATQGEAAERRNEERPAVWPALGKNANIASPYHLKSLKKLAQFGIRGPIADELCVQAADLGRDRRFKLQSAAAHLLPSERVANCLRCAAAGASGVEIYHKPETMSSRLGGLQTCGSVWMCPVCAAKITEVRRVELGKALEVARSMGLQVAFVTYTQRHHIGDDLTKMLDGMSQARRFCSAGKGGRLFRDRHHIVGSIRSLEVTYGTHGWHPHYHELLFCDGSIDVDKLTSDLLKNWGNALVKQGLKTVNEHAVKVEIANGKIADYVAKFGRDPITVPTWGPEYELSKWPCKSGYGDNRSPVDLLSEFATTGDVQAGELYKTYAMAFKGRCQLVWSRGLRDLLAMKEEISDEDIVKDVSGEEVLVARVSFEHWHQIVKAGIQSHVLAAAARNDIDVLWSVLANCQPGFVNYSKDEVCT